MKDKRFQIGKWVAILGIVIGLVVYLGYCIKIFQLMQMDSDYSNLILEASDILHGNFFMNGWTQTGISFFYDGYALLFNRGCIHWDLSGILLDCQWNYAFLRGFLWLSFNELRTEIVEEKNTGICDLCRNMRCSIFVGGKSPSCSYGCLCMGVFRNTFGLPAC